MVWTVWSGWQEVLGATWQKHNIRDANRLLFHPNPNLRNLWSKQPYSVWATRPQNKEDLTKQALRSSLSREWDWPGEATGDVRDPADFTTTRGAGGSLLEVRVLVPMWWDFQGARPDSCTHWSMSKAVGIWEKKQKGYIWFEQCTFFYPAFLLFMSQLILSLIKFSSNCQGKEFSWQKNFQNTIKQKEVHKNSSKFHHSHIIIVKILVLLITMNTCWALSRYKALRLTRRYFI